MRVVSLVPSWTETLVLAGIDVVGRTSFCIHPVEQLESIPKVGGTKKVDFGKIEALHPDFIVMDQEENTLEIFERFKDRAIVSHVTGLKDVSVALNQMASKFGSKKLREFELEWAQICIKSHPERTTLFELPGIIDWIVPAVGDETQLAYIIWKDPLMTVSKDTFIGSILNFLGYGRCMINFPQRYPEIRLADYEKRNAVLLFASEPFPFEREREFIKNLGFPAALIDGEAYSWYGVRPLQFLKSAIQKLKFA